MLESRIPLLKISLSLISPRFLDFSRIPPKLAMLDPLSMKRVLLLAKLIILKGQSISFVHSIDSPYGYRCN